MSVLPTNKYLKTYLLTRFNDRLTALKPGEKAPNFFLPDTRDSLASLSQFKGNVVLLCFWFAGCRGCVAEFQAENQLVKQFSNAPVRIISVCTQTRPAKWHEAISGAGLKTVNLFANAAWRKTLEEKYAISAYPHYVLIGADGRIIENFAPRPSQNAADKIKAALVLVGEK